MDLIILLRRLMRRRSAGVGLVILLLIVSASLLAPWISPHDHIKQSLSLRLQAPSDEHWLGTDQLGRDVFSRILWASRISLQVGLMAILIGASVGSTIGLVAGFLGGFVDSLLMRLVDILMAFPTLLLAIAVAAIVQGGGIGGLLIAIGVANIPQFARLVRGEATRLKHQDYVGAAQALGANNTRIMVRHLIPNLVSALIVMISLRVSVAILTESTLSFLGLGVSPPTAAWGVMISEGRRFLLVAPWVSLAPGVALTLTVLALNLFGDGLRDVLDPRLQNI